MASPAIVENVAKEQKSRRKSRRGRRMIRKLLQSEKAPIRNRIRCWKLTSDRHRRVYVPAAHLHLPLALAPAARREAFREAPLEASRPHPPRSVDPLVDLRAAAARLRAPGAEYLALPLGLEADLLLAVAPPPPLLLRISTKRTTMIIITKSTLCSNRDAGKFDDGDGAKSPVVPRAPRHPHSRPNGIVSTAAPMLTASTDELISPTRLPRRDAETTADAVTTARPLRVLARQPHLLFLRLRVTPPTLVWMAGEIDRFVLPLPAS